MLRVGLIPPEFWESVAMQAADPEVVYLGPMPPTPRDYYQTARCFPTIWSGSSAFVYVLMECDGEVLYVGKAREPGNRFDKHRRHKDWWEAVHNLLLIRVSGNTIAEADTLALHVERLGIRQLCPLYNIAGSVRV